MVKLTSWPGFTRTTSASEISALTSIRSSLASFTMVGALWIELMVWPASTTTATTVPSVGAVMRVRSRLILAVDRLTSARAFWASSASSSATATSTSAVAVSTVSREE